VARANARSARTAMYLNVIGAPLSVYGRSDLNAQPTTLGGYATDTWAVGGWGT
jgi:hypothetical protein